MNACEKAKIRELTSAELEAVSGGGVKSSSVLNGAAISKAQPAYPPIA